MEVWKPIPKWPEYCVSSAGRVRSEARKVERRNGFVCTVHECILKPCRHRYGHLSVLLTRPGEQQRFYISELMRIVWGDNDIQKWKAA